MLRKDDILFFISTIDENIPRCVGFTLYRKSAEDIVDNNQCDIHEQTYKYAVIEEIEHEGLYPDVKAEEWYRWSDNKHKYIRCVKPDQFKNYGNFAIG